MNEIPGWRRRPLVAMLFGLFAPGAGLVVRGRPIRAGLWFAGALACIAASPWVPFAAFGAMVVWGGALVDAGVVSSRRGALGSRGLVGALVGFIAFNLVVLITVRAVYVEGFSIPSSSMQPTLAQGDKIFAVKLGGAAKAGDVIVFRYPCDPNTFFVSRVVAVAGDSVEVRCGRLAVNQQPLPLEPDTGRCEYQETARWQSGDWATVSCQRYTEQGESRTRDVLLDAPPGEVRDHADFPELEPPPGCEGTSRGRFGELEQHARRTGPCDFGLAMRVPENHLFVLGDNRDRSSDSRIWGAVPVENVVGRATMIWFSSGPDGTRWGRIGRID